jgi:hypothetical protein
MVLAGAGTSPVGDVPLLFFFFFVQASLLVDIMAVKKMLTSLISGPAPTKSVQPMRKTSMSTQRNTTSADAPASSAASVASEMQMASAAGVLPSDTVGDIGGAAGAEGLVF